MKHVLREREGDAWCADVTTFQDFRASSACRDILTLLVSGQKKAFARLVNEHASDSTIRVAQGEHKAYTHAIMVIEKELLEIYRFEADQAQGRK